MNKFEQFFKSTSRLTYEFLKEVRTEMEDSHYRDFSLSNYFENEKNIRFFISHLRDERAEELSQGFSNLLGSLNINPNLQILVAAKVFVKTAFECLDSDPSKREVLLAMFLAYAVHSFDRLEENEETNEEPSEENGEESVESEDEDEGVIEGEILNPASNHQVGIHDNMAGFEDETVLDMVDKISAKLNIKIAFSDSIDTPLSMSLADFKKSASYINGIGTVTIHDNMASLDEQTLIEMYHNLFDGDSGLDHPSIDEGLEESKDEE
jgi:hypothetical protein